MFLVPFLPKLSNFSEFAKNREGRKIAQSAYVMGSSHLQLLQPSTNFVLPRAARKQSRAKVEQEKRASRQSTEKRDPHGHRASLIKKVTKKK